MAKKRGFALLSSAEHAKVSSKGGTTSHKKGTAREWTTAQARAAGRKGGETRRRQIEAAKAKSA